MPRSEWHNETWDEAVAVLREHFEENGFRVDVNSNMGTVTIIHERKALGIMNVTDSHLEGESPIHVVLH